MDEFTAMSNVEDKISVGSDVESIRDLSQETGQEVKET